MYTTVNSLEEGWEKNKLLKYRNNVFRGNLGHALDVGEVY